MKGYANPHLLVSARELAGIVSGPESARPLILDLRPPDAYTQGHVPGAVHLDLWGVSLIDTDPAPLNAFMWMIEHVLAGHGVDRGRPCRRVRRAFRDESGASVLVSRILRPSERAGAGWRVRFVDARGLARHS